MVRRRLIALALGAVLTACSKNRPMSDRVELPHADTTMVTNPMKVDSLLDTMPGGEMARGNDSAALRMMKKKLGP